MSDILSIISWWLVLQVLGWAVWPLAFRWLRWLPDRGFMLAKPIGLLFVSYGVWLLANFGIVENTAGGILVVVVALALVGVWAYRRRSDQGSSIRAWLREHRGLFVAYELLFLLAFVGWAIYRAHNPDISTTEKPMEFAFFNAIGRSATFPPHDPWLSGYAIAYYYFGYVMMSVLHQLSGVTAGTAFSLSNALWFALSAASAFGVVANLVLLTARRAKIAAIVFGLLGAFMLTVMGNFEAPLEIAHANNVGSADFWKWLDILDINGPPVQNPPDVSPWMPREGWWSFGWRASRVVHDYPPEAVSPVLAAVTGLPPAPNTTYQELIDEFPQFSFVLGDMHPHVLALPYALLAMALALNLFLAFASGEVTLLWRAPLWPLYALAVGGLSFLNTWDFPIYAFVLVTAIALARWRVGRLGLRNSLIDLVVLGLMGVVLYLPFYRGFTSQAAGIAPNVFNGTRLPQFFVMFGPFIVIGFMFGLALVIDTIRAGRLRVTRFALGSIGGGAVLVVGLSILAGALGFAIMRVSDRARGLFESIVSSINQAGISVTDHLVARLTDPWVPLLLAIGLVAIVLLWRARRSRSDEDQPQGTTPALPIDFVLLLSAVGLLLAVGVEFFYIIDGFGDRMNTVFKFYYQAWALWSVVAAFGAYYLLSSVRRASTLTRTVCVAVVVVLVGLGSFYPFMAIRAEINPDTAPNLDAMAAIAPFAPDEYAAVNWFNQNVTGAPVILEAVGSDYHAETSRISAWTGLPSALGWSGHEGQWRGNDELQRPREADITTIYSTTDTTQALVLLNQYHVRYVYVGPNERRLYEPNLLQKFDSLLPIAFQQGAVTIYRVP